MTCPVVGLLKFPRLAGLCPTGQLSVTTCFFDYCVPNPPGFSSSVAAVTILPGASQLAAAWKKWYIATKAVQRLRFIRRTLLGRGHHLEQLASEENGDDSQMEGEVEDDDDEVYMQSSSRRARYVNEVLGDVTDDDVEGMFLRSLQMGPEQTAVYSMELAKVSFKYLATSEGSCCSVFIKRLLVCE